MNDSNINHCYNDEGDNYDMNTASDDYDNYTVKEQVSISQGTNSKVRYSDTSRQRTNVRTPQNEGIVRGNSDLQVENVIASNVQMQLNTTVVKVNPVTARDVWIRLKQHKWFILAFVFGVILTLLIVVPVMTSNQSEIDNPLNLTLKFDRKSTFTSLFLSTDNKIVSNLKSKATPNEVREHEVSYHGILGDRSFKQTDKIYFEIMYTFSKPFTFLFEDDSNSLVARVGLVNQNRSFDYLYDTFDHFDFDDSSIRHGWYIFLHTCNSSVCMSLYDHGVRSDTLINLFSYSNPTRTRITGRLGFFVNMERKEFSVIDKDTLQILHTFLDVSSPEDIFPIFTVDYQILINVQIEILYSYDFHKLPVFNIIA